MNRELLVKRIWERVKIRGLDDCWIWTGQRSASGYGIYRIRKGPRTLSHYSTILAHRFVYEERVELIPEGLIIRHSCHTPLCCNPKHMSTGTTQDNSDDMVRAGRSLKGEKNVRAKLTEKEVVRILQLRKEGLTLKEIAAKFKTVTLANIGYICQRKIWSSVEQR